MDLYTKENQKEIVDNFRELLKDADNFPREKDPDDYKPFWVGLRDRGAGLLGLTRYLQSSLRAAHIVIERLEQSNKSDKDDLELDSYPQ
mgnify:CR=1 FL=1|jgi:hypothetical protein|tara:strand:+ start:195 stop:461 length:267 start_codon:yes stop_codon:yes gene_type:complete